MPESTPPTQSQRRRKVLGYGALGFVALYGVGGYVFDKQIVDDLETRVPAELAADGYEGITAHFSGQDGTLECTTPFADEQARKAVEDAAYGVHGVHSIKFDRSCLVATPAEPTPSSSVAPAPSSTAPVTATMADVLAADPQYSRLVVAAKDAGLDLSDPALNPTTLFAPTNAAFDALGQDAMDALTADPARLKTLLMHHMTDGRLKSTDMKTGDLTMQDGTTAPVVADGKRISVGPAAIVDFDIEASNGVVQGVDKLIIPDGFDLSAPGTPATVKVDGALDAGVITLTGKIANEADRATLVAAAQGTGDPATVNDQLEVAPDGADTATVGQVATLVTALRTDLVDGRAGVDGTSLYLAGHYADEATHQAAQAAADSVNATATLEAVPEATASDASQLEAELNAYVKANPILFQPGSATLVPDAEGILDHLAGQLKALSGISVAIEGHTDSDGSAASNLALSQKRADAVLAGLVNRGIDPATLTATGYGSTQPVLDANGVEDKAASRRVEFKVTTS